MKINSRAELGNLMRVLNLPKVVVECGTAEGIFSQEMFGWGLDKLYLVDIWERVPFLPGCGSFEQSWHDKNFKRVKELFGDKENVIMLKGFSYKMAEQIPDESLGLAYLDAAHDYHSVKSDIDSFWGKLVKGGIMAFHDYENYDYGVNRAVREFAGRERLEIHELIEDGEKANIGAYIIK